MTLRNTALLGLGLSSALLIAAPAATQNDTILRVDGKHLTKCKILKLELDKIVYSKSGKESDILVSRTTGFRFGTVPDDYARAESADNRNDHANAGKLFAAAAEAAKSEPVKSVAGFFAGRAFSIAAQSDASHANAAVAALEAYVQVNPNGRYLPEAQVRLAQARLAGGDAAAAETMLASMASTASTGGWPLRWIAHIQHTLATAQFAQQKYTDARSSYQSVESAADSAMGQDKQHTPELTTIKTDALVMQGETYIGEKLLSEALNYFQTLSTSPTKGVKAAAQAGQGQILFLQGGTDPSKLRQAQMALARASTEPDTSDSTSAKALYYMGKVLDALGDNEKGALARAKTYYQSVTNSYGKTSWAAKARKELDG